jgi:hypothetical protein
VGHRAVQGLDLGTFGVFRDMSAVLTDNPDAVQRQLDWAAGVEREFKWLTDEPSGQATWQRVTLRTGFGQASASRRLHRLAAPRTKRHCFSGK